MIDCSMVAAGFPAAEGTHWRDSCNCCNKEADFVPSSYADPSARSRTEASLAMVLTEIGRTGSQGAGAVALAGNENVAVASRKSLSVMNRSLLLTCTTIMMMLRVVIEWREWGLGVVRKCWWMASR